MVIVEKAQDKLGGWCAFAHKRHTHTTLSDQYSYTNGLFITKYMHMYIYFATFF